MDLSSLDWLSLDRLSGIGPIALQILIGVVIADFVSGLLHWAEDAYGDPNWPILGRYVIQPNILHHQDPQAFTKRNYWIRNRAVIVIAAAIGLGLWATGALNVMWATALIVGAHANETHNWAHLPTGQVHPFIRRMQQLGLLLSPSHHWRHHRARFDTHYCSVTNYLNPFLDTLKFWRVLEGMIEGGYRIRPRGDAKPDGKAEPVIGRRALHRARRTACARTWLTARWAGFTPKTPSWANAA